MNEVSTLCSTVCFSNNVEIGIDYIDNLNQQNELKHMFTCECMVAAAVIVQAVILALRKRHQWECFLFLQSPDAIIWKE